MLLEESTITKRLQSQDMTKERFHRAILSCCLLTVTKAIVVVDKPELIYHIILRPTLAVYKGYANPYLILTFRSTKQRSVNKIDNKPVLPTQTHLKTADF